MVCDADTWWFSVLLVLRYTSIIVLDQYRCFLPMPTRACVAAYSSYSSTAYSSALAGDGTDPFRCQGKKNEKRWKARILEVIYAPFSIRPPTKVPLRSGWPGGRTGTCKCNALVDRDRDEAFPVPSLWPLLLGGQLYRTAGFCPWKTVLIVRAQHDLCGSVVPYTLHTARDGKKWKTKKKGPGGHAHAHCSAAAAESLGPNQKRGPALHQTGP